MKLTSAIWFGVCLLAGASVAVADTSRFEGRWTDPQSQTITSIEIRNGGSTLLLHAFGRCHPQDCDMGEAVVRTYAPGLDPKLKDTVDVLSAEYVTRFLRTLLVVYPEDGDRLRVETFDVFTDSSGRWPCHHVQMLVRSAAVSPLNTGDLAQPTQLSPANGSAFSMYPRTTTLEWSAVPGAVRYGVEVDCYECCQTGKWCSEAGGSVRSAVVNGLSYTFNFVGAQPGRWRVWAIGPGGAAGPKTGWFEFSYTR